MSRAESLLKTLSTRRGAILLLVVFIPVFVMIAITTGQIQSHTGGIGIIDAQQGYSVEKVNEILGSYGERGLALYARIQWLDLINPALYAALLAALIYRLGGGEGALWPAMVPFIAAGLDYTENFTIFLMIRQYPDLGATLVGVSSTLSLLKTAAMAAIVLVLLVRLVMAWHRSRR